MVVQDDVLGPRVGRGGSVRADLVAVMLLGDGKFGAEGGIRTRTSISSQPPEDCVSTNFTTSAYPVAEAGIEPAAKGL